MKQVKFNVTTSYHNIPDNKYDAECIKMKKLREENLRQYCDVIAIGDTNFEFVDVQAGDIVNVPDWYYNAHKDDIMTVANSFDKYTDREGNRVPFDMQEAYKHGDINDLNETMLKVRKFVLYDAKEAKRGIND